MKIKIKWGVLNKIVLLPALIGHATKKVFLSNCNKHCIMKNRIEFMKSMVSLIKLYFISMNLQTISFLIEHL